MRRKRVPALAYTSRRSFLCARGCFRLFSCTCSLWLPCLLLQPRPQAVNPVHRSTVATALQYMLSDDVFPSRLSSPILCCVATTLLPSGCSLVSPMPPAPPFVGSLPPAQLLSKCTCTSGTSHFWPPHLCSHCLQHSRSSFFAFSAVLDVELSPTASVGTCLPSCRLPVAHCATAELFGLCAGFELATLPQREVWPAMPSV